MKQLATISKTSVHAADTSVSAAQAKNPMDSADSQVNSSPAVTGKGLVWDEATAEAFETIRGVIAHELTKYGLQQHLEDVYQDTYLEAFHSSATYDPAKGELSVWFRGVAWTVVMRCIRKNLRREGRECSYEAHLEDAAGVVDELEETAQTEHTLRALSLAVGHHVAFERALVTAFRCDGDTGAAAEFLGIPRRTVQWSQQMVRKFGVVIARALTVRAAREEYGKAHEPVTVGELLWCLPQEVDAAKYAQLLGQVGSVEKVSKADLMTVTGLSGTAALQYASEVVRMLSIARSVVETGTLAIAEKEA